MNGLGRVVMFKLCLDSSVMQGLKLVEETISESIRSDEPALWEMARYATGSGGKRFRPLLMVLSYKSVGGTSLNELAPLAASWELIHTATLVHDDINDDSIFRRRKTSLFKRFGIVNAVVTGDYLFTKGFKLGGMYGKELVTITADACSKMAEGEILQMKNLHKACVSEKTYLEQISLKTAAPMAAICKQGAMLGGGRCDEVEGLERFGFNLGMAYQIVDDILDVVGDESVLGKPVGVDICRGVVTLPHIAALRQADPVDREKLLHILEKNFVTPDQVEKAIEIIKSTNAIEYALGKARKYKDMAKMCLSPSLDKKYRDMLLQLADSVVKRSY
ncbi:MAG: polyprenyl synthetase family protein [Methanobacteriota archaeon]|nr:MAG: polyprenyl synthetase family protein [Euryarchaeota archaeon]